MSIFEAAIAFVLTEEGGYVDDPRDPGGETKYGISRRAYPLLDIAGLTEEQAEEIYRSDYWSAIQGERLPAAVAFYLLDTAANCGPEAAAKLLQRAAGVLQDGVIGPRTLAAAAAAGVLARLDEARREHYRALPTFPRFGRGWLARAGRCFAEAQALQRSAAKT